jgi:hypothetical protein
MFAPIQGETTIMSTHEERSRRIETESRILEIQYPMQVKQMTKEETKDYHRKKLYDLSLKSTDKDKEQRQQESKEFRNDDKDTNNKDRKEDKRIQIAYERVKQQAHKLFIDEYGEAHIALTISDHLEVFTIDSNKFRDWFRLFNFEQFQSIMSDDQISKLCSMMRSYASSEKYGGEQINLNLRTALINIDNQQEWLYDLTNKNWEFIKITSDGWYIIKNEIIFRRYLNQKPQVIPDRNYEPNIFDRFMRLINVKDDDKNTKLLLKVYIVSLFIPEIQKVVLMLHGSQGSAKTFLQELIKSLVDPSIPKTISLPRDKQQLIQQLSHYYVTSYDNISHIPAWISDEFCRAVSGSGSVVRKYYTNEEDLIRIFKRCIMFNGVNLGATKADLLDRGLIILLERILEDNQRLPADIWKQLEELKPQLLGYILDILVKVLTWKNNGELKLQKLPRMAEFAQYGEMISRSMGNKENEFIDAFTENRELQTDQVIEENQIARCLEYMFFNKYETMYNYADKKDPYWIGTASQLLGELDSIAMSVNDLHVDVNGRYWPKASHILSRRINEILPILREIGLIIEFEKTKDKTRKRLIKIRKVASTSVQRPINENQAQNEPKMSDATSDAYVNSVVPSIVASVNNDQNQAQNQASDASDASDGIIRNILSKDNDIKGEG